MLEEGLDCLVGLESFLSLPKQRLYSQLCNREPHDGLEPHALGRDVCVVKIAWSNHGLPSEQPWTDV